MFHAIPDIFALEVQLLLRHRALMKEDTHALKVATVFKERKHLHLAQLERLIDIPLKNQSKIANNALKTPTVMKLD